jgi:hypothetical protein
MGLQSAVRRSAGQEVTAKANFESFPQGEREQGARMRAVAL